jgi:N-acetylglutamate synthase-like GNAT family acetyltransferase
VDADNLLMGSVAIVKYSETEAQLRWFLLHPVLRGKGLGNRLVEEAVTFCRESGYRSVFLWTVSPLLTAAQVYRKFGFEITEEHTHELWGCKLTEQRFDLSLYP